MRILKRITKLERDEEVTSRVPVMVRYKAALNKIAIRLTGKPCGQATSEESEQIYNVLSEEYLPSLSDDDLDALMANLHQEILRTEALLKAKRFKES